MISAKQVQLFSLTPHKYARNFYFFLYIQSRNISKCKNVNLQVFRIDRQVLIEFFLAYKMLISPEFLSKVLKIVRDVCRGEKSTLRQQFILT